MSFVFPALLGGLILAGAPVLLHLILRKKPKTLPFPAFRFLVARHQKNQRKLQLRHLLLLALRMLLIAGLIAAVARPRLLENNLGLSRERPVAAVFVIDVSASMDARSSDNRSRLEDVQKRALELLDELPEGSRVAVVSSSDVRGDWASSPFQARQRIQNFKIQPASPPLPRSILAGLNLLAEIATRKDDEPATRLPRLLCVFSDTTRGAWSQPMTPQVVEASDGVPVPYDSLKDAGDAIAAVLSDDAGSFKEPLTELRDLIPRLKPGDFPLTDRPLQIVQQARAATREAIKNADEKRAAPLRELLKRLVGFQTMWFDVGLDPPRDLAIVDVEWPTTALGLPQEAVRPGEPLLLRPTISALGQDFQTTLTVGPAKVPRDFPKGERTVVPIEIDTAAQKMGQGPHSLEFAVPIRDALAIDNTRYATFVVRSPRKAILVADRPDAGDSDLARALGIHHLDVTIKTPGEIEAGVSAGTDAVFLFGLAAPSEAMWNAVLAFAKAGGGVAILPGGEEMKPTAYQSAAAKAVLPGEFLQPVRLAKLVDKNEGTRWDLRPKTTFRHPFLRPFERWIAEGGVDFIELPRRVLAFWDTRPTSPDVVLVKYLPPNDRPALLERRLGAGKAIQFTTPFDLRDPPWNTYMETANSSFFIVVTGLLSRHLTGELEPVRVNFLLGREEPSVLTRDVAGRGTLTLRGPETGTVVADEKSPRTGIPQANVPGNYLIQDSNKTTVAAFSVNLPPEEIDLSPWPLADVENLFGSGVRIAADRQANLRELLQGHWNEPIELFPYFMILLLILLAVENWLANAFYRRED